MLSYDYSERNELVSNNERLNEMLEMLDELHTAASEGQATSFAGMNHQELVGLLNEIVYTAREALAEIKDHRAQFQPTLRLVPKVEERSASA